jgi:hypothetical protein
MVCKQCGEPLPSNSTVRRSFCNDVCRVQFNRALKADDLFFDAMVTIRKLAKAGKNAELKQLQQAIDDLINN